MTEFAFSSSSAWSRASWAAVGMVLVMHAPEARAQCRDQDTRRDPLLSVVGASNLSSDSGATRSESTASSANSRSQAKGLSGRYRIAPPVTPAPQPVVARQPSAPVRRGAGVTAAAPSQIRQVSAGITYGISNSRSPRSTVGGLDITSLRSALEHYRLDTGRWPNASEGLSALVRKPAGAVGWRGPYVALPYGKPEFTDPWGNAYQLSLTKDGFGNVFGFAIRSNGPDGLAGTQDDLEVRGG